MLNPMRVPIVLLTSLVLAFPYASVQAQRSTPDLIAQAFQLSSGGQPKAITEAAAGRNTFAYATAEDAYAQILRASGAKEEAARLSKEATDTLADLELRSCNGCTINASGFR